MDGALLPAIELLSDPEWIARRLSAQHDPAQEGGEHLVDQPQHHQRIMPDHLPRTNEQVTGYARSFGHPQAAWVAGRRKPIDPAPRCTQRSPAPAPQAADRAPAAGGLGG
jgi:hypothetical protein